MHAARSGTTLSPLELSKQLLEQARAAQEAQSFSGSELRDPLILGEAENALTLPTQAQIQANTEEFGIPLKALDPAKPGDIRLPDNTTSQKPLENTVKNEGIPEGSEQQHHEAAIRPPFCLSGFRIVQESPISVIAKLYTDAKTLRKKQACLRYLLHYQHYNAEFTQLENRQLGYPEPLCAPQELPGYFRTEYNRRLELVKPYVQLHMDGQKLFEILPNDKKIIDIINLSARSAIPVLKFFFKNHHIIELQDIKKSGFLTSDGEESLNKILVIRLESNDFSKTALEIMEERLQKIDKKQKPGTLRVQNPNLHFLFLIEVDGIDCIIMWGAKWSRPKKDNTLEFLRIDYQEGCSLELMSALNEGQRSKQGVLYISLAEGAIQYRIFNKDNVVTEGRITTEDLGAEIMMPTGDNLQQFASIKKVILGITSKRGHTRQGLFGDTAFSILGETGAVPDRLPPASGKLSPLK